MAVRSGFFNGVNGDRRYDAKRFAEYFAAFIGNGIFPNPSTNLQVMGNNNMTVIVKTGKAWIDGYILINDDDYILQIDPADGVLNRIDRIVARYDTVDREIRLEIKKGAFASNPVVPGLQRDADAYELGLADIQVNKGIISITQANITDLRLNNDLCGIVHGTVNQVDITTLFNQYEAKFAQKEIDFETEFNIWFDDIKNQLGDDVAGGLLNQINDLAGEGRTNETVKSAYDKAEQAFQSGVDRKNQAIVNINSKGVNVDDSMNFSKVLDGILDIETDKTGDATALASDILASKTAYAKGNKLIGTIPSKGVATITPGITPILIEAGQYLSGRQTIAGVAVPVANVLVGTTIAGQTGTMKNNGAVNYTITSEGGIFIIPKDYHNGVGKVTAKFPNNIPANVRAGVSLGGVMGALIPKGNISINETVLKSQSNTNRNTVKTLPLLDNPLLKDANIIIFAPTNSGGNCLYANARSDTNTYGEFSTDVSIFGYGLMSVWVNSQGSKTNYIKTLSLVKISETQYQLSYINGDLNSSPSYIYKIINNTELDFTKPCIEVKLINPDVIGSTSAGLNCSVSHD